MFKELVNLADYLNRAGLTKEAYKIKSIIEDTYSSDGVEETKVRMYDEMFTTKDIMESGSFLCENKKVDYSYEATRTGAEELITELMLSIGGVEIIRSYEGASRQKGNQRVGRLDYKPNKQQFNMKINEIFNCISNKDKGKLSSFLDSIDRYWRSEVNYKLT